MSISKTHILAHRGSWQSIEDKNSWAALCRAMSHGYGLETDVRDLDGKLVISHDPPEIAENTLYLEALLDFYKSNECRGWLAINIKADGLSAPVANALASRNIDRYFVFDMSVPDSLAYIKNDMRAYVRLSEYEGESILQSMASGVWVDNFSGDFDQIGAANRLLQSNKQVAIVSPELHGRSHLSLWKKIRKNLPASENLMLCTDFPDQAATFWKTEDAN
ncbi:MAG: hypothetical protein ABF335_01770 [Alphaproteobacteria bacterium]